MKASIRIEEVKENQYIVVIDNGYGRNLTMTEKISLEEAKQWVNDFTENGHYTIINI